jgi:hypothetical protein
VSGIITRFTEQKRIAMLEALGEAAARRRSRLS